MNLKVWMVFEAVGKEKDEVEESLEEHLEKLESEGDIEIVENDWSEAEEMEDPHPGIEKGYSMVVETVITIESLDRLVETVINYGPTYIQVEEPDNYNLGLAELQDTVQNVATTMHQYAQMGAGGVLISRNRDDS